MTHIVMTGTDVSMYTNPNGSETAARFGVYAAKLDELSQHSQLTYVAVGAPAGSHTISIGNLTIVPVKNLLQLYGALKALAAISLITTQTTTEESWLAYLYACPRHIPVVVQEHNDPFDARNYNGSALRKSLLHLRHLIALQLLRCASAARPVSPAVAEKLKPFLHNKPVAVLPVPVSIKPLERCETAPNLLFVGRLDPQKNVAGFLQIAALVKKKHPDLTIDIIGDGTLRAQLEQMATELGLASCTRFHGWVDYNQLAVFYARASLFVAPSWYEGFGRVILEALICGTPVISSNTAGPSFILQADGSGLLLEADDTTGMAQAATHLLDNPDLREELRQKGYKTAARFSAQQMSRDWMDFLLKLV